MKRTIIGFVLAGFCLWASPPSAAAQPAQYITVDDSIFGISATHVFVIRTIESFLNEMTVSVEDQYVVSKNIETGRVENMWPLNRTISDIENLRQSPWRKMVNSDFVHLEGSINPHGILLSRDADGLPAHVYNREDDTSGPDDWTADLLSIGPLRSPKYVLETDELFARLNREISDTANVLQPYSESRIASLEFDHPSLVLSSSQFSYGQCDINGLLYLTAIGAKNGVQLAKIYCENGASWVAIFVVVPPA